MAQSLPVSPHREFGVSHQQLQIGYTLFVATKRNLRARCRLYSDEIAAMQQAGSFANVAPRGINNNREAGQRGVGRDRATLKTEQ